MTSDDLVAVDAAVKKMSRLAGRLGSGDSECHVQRSLAELTGALGRREAPEVPLDRVVSSVRQLQHARQNGLRRDQQRGAVGIERLLEAIQEDLLPILRRGH
jgi:hypothetical protein